MKYRLVCMSFIFIHTVILALSSYAQKGGIKGRVFDGNTGKSLPGVNIIIDEGILAVTDEKGNYFQKLDTGTHTLLFKYVGYREKAININLSSFLIQQKDIYLHPQSIELSTAVVSASRYEQKLSDVIVSMEVLPASYIETVNTLYLDETISIIPGVDILDGQANIRGGSGYSYGAGSRVLVLLDGLPILTGGVDDVKWNSLPVEIIEQAEILKGASSALYGTSALNGVINLRTTRPGIEPSTTAEFSLGAYMKPEREEMVWFWDRNPIYGNVKFSHLRKEGPVDIVISGSGLYDEGYRQDNDMQYLRMNAGIKYNSPGRKGLSAGMNMGFHIQSLTDFLIWQDADSGAYIQNPDAITPMHGNRINLDPYILYFDTRGGRHSLNTRFYHVANIFEEDPDKDNYSDVYFGEYRYQKIFIENLNWTIGTAFSYTEGKTSLYGNHYGSTQALYTQLNYTFFGKLGASLGLRWERYTLDKTDEDSRPVFRAGINYEAGRRTFIRASYGQGYRYPSMAEKYTFTNLGGLKIFPNYELNPETGWSAEIGIKQGVLINNWSGYVDLAGYWTEYVDMIEFVFGVFNPENQPPSLEYVGFKSLNTGKARINGIDISLGGQGEIDPLALKYFVGYTYMNPVDLSQDVSDSLSTEDQILKYRYRHAVKGDIALFIRQFDLGITAIYRSFMERIDEAFEESVLGQYFFPGLKEYRLENDDGAVIFNLRAGWQLSPSSKISFHINNLFNKEYMGRPGDLNAPRNMSVQYIFKIN